MFNRYSIPNWRIICEKILRKLIKLQLIWSGMVDDQKKWGGIEVGATFLLFLNHLPQMLDVFFH